jgi:hypothetical protein
VTARQEEADKTRCWNQECFFPGNRLSSRLQLSQACQQACLKHFQALIMDQEMPSAQHLAVGGAGVKRQRNQRVEWRHRPPDRSSMKHAHEQRIYTLCSPSAGGSCACSVSGTYQKSCGSNGSSSGDDVCCRPEVLESKASLGAVSVQTPVSAAVCSHPVTKTSVPLKQPCKEAQLRCQGGR